MQCPGFETAHSLLSAFLSFLHCPITVKAKSPPKYAKKRAMETIKTHDLHYYLNLAVRLLIPVQDALAKLEVQYNFIM